MAAPIEETPRQTATNASSTTMLLRSAGALSDARMPRDRRMPGVGSGGAGRVGNAGRTGNAGAAETAVAARVFREILLVIVLGKVELRTRSDLRGDFAET